MLQALVAKKVIEMVLKKVMEKRAIKNMRKYVEQDNELDIKVKDLENENVILMKQMDIMNRLDRPLINPKGLVQLPDPNFGPLAQTEREDDIYSKGE